jgi:hypothetical protein
LSSELTQAATALTEQRFGDILEPLERAAAIPTPDLMHWQQVRDIAGRIGDDDVALHAARELVKIAPKDWRHRLVLRDLLGETAAVREALTLARKLEDEQPTDPMLTLSSAVLLGRLGRDDEAVRALRTVLRRVPGNPLAWEILANLKTFKPQDPLLQELEPLATRSPDRPETAGLAYAMGKACDDIGDYEQALRWFARGSARILGNRLPRMDSFFQEAADVRAAFPADRFAAGQGHTRIERPILVLGCPRSGTTLVERILGTSPAAISGGELKLLRLACLGFTPPSPERVARFVETSGGEAAAWERVGEAYVGKLRARFGTADGIVDKGLVNYLYVGAIAIGLPQARIVHVRRDPMDVAWSCFRRRFHSGLAWSYHFDSIAAFLRVYQDTMDHWNEVLPGRILSVEFEQLVNDADAQTARLFDFVGLDRPADWRSFHEKKGAVITASQLQVRRPLNSDGVGAWRRYEKFLGPLRDSLARNGVRGVTAA